MEEHIPSEAFLHFVWRTKQFCNTQFVTTEGKPIRIVKAGHLNTNAGPDFLEGIINIANTEWHGHIEMHRRSSDWNRHNHQTDAAYNSVILHVVWEHDAEITTLNGSIPPTLILKDYIARSIVQSHQNLMQSKTWIPCQSTQGAATDHRWQFWLESVIVERMQAKTGWLAALVQHWQYDWEQVCYLALAKCLGMHVNGEAFLLLAERVQLKTLLKYRDNLHKMEALLFGVAGFLTDSHTCDSQYYHKLRQSYCLLKVKHSLKEMQVSQWKFMRLRPLNFPTLRIAQLAQIIATSGRLFQKILEDNDARTLSTLFSVRLPESSYWTTHYKFGTVAKLLPKSIGKRLQYNILINLVSPLLFLYGIHRQENRLKEAALDLLRSLPSEDNAVIRKWNTLNILSQDALHSQALLHLKQNYCDAKRCLECQIGYRILRNAR